MVMPLNVLKLVVWLGSTNRLLKTVRAQPTALADGKLALSLYKCSEAVVNGVKSKPQPRAGVWLHGRVLFSMFEVLSFFLSGIHTHKQQINK